MHESLCNFRAVVTPYPPVTACQKCSWLMPITICSKDINFLALADKSEHLGVESYLIWLLHFNFGGNNFGNISTL